MDPIRAMDTDVYTIGKVALPDYIHQIIATDVRDSPVFSVVRAS